MNQKPCFNCGGKLFRADRSLAGRLVCTKCGKPFNKNIEAGILGTSSRNLFIGKSSSKFSIYLAILIIIVLIIVFIT